MIFIQKYKNNNQHSSGFGKYYGRVKIVETVGIEKIAQRMQDNCTVKTSDVMAVLNELGPTITQLLQAPRSAASRSGPAPRARPTRPSSTSRTT